MIRNPYQGADHHQKLTGSSDWWPNHNTKFERNQLIRPTFAVILHEDRQTKRPGGITFALAEVTVLIMNSRTRNMIILYYTIICLIDYIPVLNCTL